jgi:hypothetical protein
LLAIFIISGAVRNLNGDRSTANRAIGLGVEPCINTRSVERVLAHAQLLHFFPLHKHRQAHRTLAANNIFDMGFLLILDIRNLLSVTDIPTISLDGEPPGGASVAPSKRVGRALHGEEEGVDQGGDGDHGDESENELERGQVNAARRRGKGRRWSAENGGCALHDGEKSGVRLAVVFVPFLSFFSFLSFFLFVYLSSL